MLIPYEQLSDEAMAGLIDEFVTRDGTDESNEEAKARRVRTMLRRGEAAVAWDEENESATIVRVEPGKGNVAADV